MPVESGYYVRVMRDGEWQAVDLLTLTPSEIDQLEYMDLTRGWRWVRVLLEWIKENAQE